MTAGTLLPAFLLSRFDALDTGIVVSLGALAISITDSAGPIHHRRNGMLITVILGFLIAFSTGMLAGSPVLFGIYLTACCFLFSMAGVYGARASGIGVAALLILILNISQAGNPVKTIAFNALYMAVGG